eukprot:6130158-Prymnesium_polylepis.2
MVPVSDWKTKRKTRYWSVCSHVWSRKSRTRRQQRASGPAGFSGSADGPGAFAVLGICSAASTADTRRSISSCEPRLFPALWAFAVRAFCARRACAAALALTARQAGMLDEVA